MVKRSINSLLIASAFFISGCCSVPQQALSQASNNALLSDAFVQLMEEGETTREQEKAFIHANRRAWHAQNFALNDVSLPADLQPGSENTDLLKILQNDPTVRTRLNAVREALQPQPNNSGN